MKALTVRPPWAGAMFVPPSPILEPKSIENRPWPTSIRDERIAIHAGLHIDRAAVTALGITTPIRDQDRGVILGTVEVTGCHEAGSDQCEWHKCRENVWAMWPALGDRLFHWELEHPREFVTPIPARGALGLWEPGPSVAHLITIAEVKP